MKAAAARPERTAAGDGLGVACAMFGPMRGGLEHSFVDYCDALGREGHRVTALVHAGGAARSAAERLPGVEVVGLRNVGEWDPVAAWRCRRLLLRRRTDVAFTHGRRATNLVRRALQGTAIPQVAKAPNYTLGHLIGLDHVIATTADLRRALIAAGQPPERVTVVPNFIRVPADVDVARPRPGDAGPPLIGGLGRFVAKKGFEVYIEALALLRQRGRAFRAVLGGDGALAGELRRLARERGLGEDVLEFPGWIADRRAFFEALDVFCVPSLDEPFGIVVIEGFAHGTATVVTDTSGPLEIARHGETALVVPRGDPAALADALAALLDDPGLRLRLARAARETARVTYDLPVVGRRASDLLRRVAAAAARAG